MRIFANMLIGFGMFSVILATSMVDEVHAPLTDGQFLVQIGLLFFGLGFAFIGAIMRFMSE